MGHSPASALASQSALGPQLPLRLGRFTLCETLGAGGMATVYLARMELAAGLERMVALKTIHPHLANEPNFVDMFLDEARIAAHVEHPNVCSTHDFGELDGVYYLAMEHLLGEPLFDVINRMVERFEEIREVLPFLAARIIADSAEGIHAAHSAHGPNGEDLQIVHRDVSPQNLFVTYDGAVKVVDFGCAKAAERVAHTSTGVLKGKVAYAAPEQLGSEHVDHRADVWALGVCLWECLTLSPLFTRESAMQTAMAVMKDPIPAACEGREWVPDTIAEIAARALAREPDKRYESARELSRDLRRFIADSGFTLESAELAEWMEFLFEDGRRARVEQQRRAQELSIREAPEATLARLEAAAPSAGPVPSYPSARAPEPSRAVEEEAPRSVTELAVASRRGRGRWGWALLALIGAAVGGWYAHQHYELAPWVYEALGLEGPTTPATADWNPVASPPETTRATLAVEEVAAEEAADVDEASDALETPPPTPSPSTEEIATANTVEDEVPDDSLGSSNAVDSPDETPRARLRSGRRGRSREREGFVTTFSSGSPPPVTVEPSVVVPPAP